ncbi:MAG TPA: hypothetical protein VIY96_05280 [Thermoanaerobaculia bacterium]
MKQDNSGRVIPVGFLQGSSGRKAVVAREDWPLLAIAASDGLRPIQLQKSLFLLGQRFPELATTGFYEFRAVGGGDFCEQIYVDAEALAKKGLVAVRYPEGAGSRQYRLTPAGVKTAKRLEEHVRPAISKSLRKLVAWVNTRTMDQLFRTSTDTTAAVRPDPDTRRTARPH